MPILTQGGIRHRCVDIGTTVSGQHDPPLAPLAELPSTVIAIGPRVPTRVHARERLDPPPPARLIESQPIVPFPRDPHALRGVGNGASPAPN